MFGIDGPEFVVILIVLIVVVGPKDLPKMLKALGKATARMRATANEFRRQFDEAMHEADLDDLQKTMSDVTDLDPRKKLTKIFDPIRDVAKDVKASIEVKEIEVKEIADESTARQSSNKRDIEENKDNGLSSSEEPVRESSVRVDDIGLRKPNDAQSSTVVSENAAQKKGKTASSSSSKASTLSKTVLPARTKTKRAVKAAKSPQVKQKSNNLSKPEKAKLSGTGSLKK